jgi:hypothetical protein
MRNRTLTLALAGSVMLAASAGAQTHKGFWAGFDLGAARQSLDCSACPAERNDVVPLPNLNAAIRIGWTLRDNLLLGLEDNSIEGSDWATTAIMAVAQLYPRRQSPAFVRVGFGALIVDSHNREPADHFENFGVLVSLGYDIARGRYSISPTVTFANSLGGAIVDHPPTSLITTSARPRFVAIGIGVHWY